MRTKLFLAGLAFMALASIANGQSQQNADKQSNKPAKGLAFTDENKDGICDNFENRTANTQTAQGNCFYRGGKGRGNGNGNGNCDGRGPGKGQGQSQGRGVNFVDKNNDGICDNLKTPAGKIKE